MRQIFKKPGYAVAILIVALLGFLRFWQLDKVPVSLFGDEIDVGLQAVSIAQTGRDYFGNKLPVLFHSFAEYRLPMQLYLDVPFVKLIGPNEVGVRMPAVLMGVVSIVAFYFLAKEFTDKKVALVASLFMAASPWHFIYSRQANDAGILLPFVILGTWFFVKGTQQYKFLFFSAIAFSLGIYAYAISSLFIPLFVIMLTIISRRKIFSYGVKRLTFVGLAAFIILSPYIIQSLTGRTTERFSYISVASKKEITLEVEAKRKWSNTTLSRILDNKYTTVGEKIVRNYLQSYSISFLFSDGDSNPRQSLSGYGVFYHFDLFFILVAIWVTISAYTRLPDEKKKIFQFLGVWLLFAPLPSSSTEGGGTHASRLILMLPPLILLSAMGFNVILERAKSARGKVVLGLVILFMLYEATRFFHNYFVIWPKESWRYWHFGFKEVAASVRTHEANFDRVLLNNTYEPMMPRFIFWYGYDMGLFQRQFEDDKHIKDVYPGFNGFKLGDKYYFGELVKPIENLAKEGNLIVASADKDVSNPGIFDNPNLYLLDIIYSPEHTPLFYIYSKSQ